MLYLAEVQKKSGGLLGGGKAELRLLAYQRSEQNWSAVSGEEVIPCDEANGYNAGAMVLVDLTTNKQVQRVQEATRPLVSILQSYSRQSEKYKTQEEEIEQWKQSLTYQSQELNRREMEMEARREQLQQMEEDFEQLEQQRQDIETEREKVNREREEIERKTQDLEGAWAHLKGEQQKLEELKAQFQPAATLDHEQAQRIHELLNRISSAGPRTDAVRQQLSTALETLAQQQEGLNQHWQALNQQRDTANRLQGEVDRQSQTIHARWQEWHESQDSLEQARAELKTQQNAVNLKQEYARMLSLQIQNHEDLHQQVYRLVDTSDHVSIGQHIDVEALERMPLDELQRLVQDLEREQAKVCQFVESQEEELVLKQEEIDALQARIQAANEYDRLSLENELADEQDGYQMLNETLVGQRRNLREREGVLKQHQSVLRRRQGHAGADDQENEIDLGPILGQLEAQRQQQTEELRKLESQIEQMQVAIQQAQSMITSQAADLENRRNDLKQQEQALTEQRTTAAQTWGRVNLYQEMLQPIQDRVDALRQQLDAMSGTVSADIQAAVDNQLLAIAEIRQTLMSLTDIPELAAS